MGMKVFEASGTFNPVSFGLGADTEFSVICVGGGSSGYCHHNNASNIQDGRYYYFSGGSSGFLTYWTGKLSGAVSVTVGKGGVPVRKQTTGYYFSGYFPGSASSFGSYATAAGGTGTDGSSLGGGILYLNYVNPYSATSNHTLAYSGAGGGAGGFVIGDHIQFGNGGTGLPAYNGPMFKQDTLFLTSLPGGVRMPTGHGGMGGGTTCCLLDCKIDDTTSIRQWIDFTAGHELTGTATRAPTHDAYDVDGVTGRGYGAGGCGKKTGSKYAIITNGSQYQLMWNSLPGRDGVVIVTW